MSDPLPKDLSALWEDARADATAKPPPPLNRQKLAALSHRPRRESVRACAITIAVLSVTLGVLIVFFERYLPPSDYYSQLGVGLMLGSLVGRILLEIVSLILVVRIGFTNATRQFVKASRTYLNFRWKIHRFYIAFFFLAYAGGFYSLLYTYRGITSAGMLVLLAVSMPVILGAVYYLAIRPGQMRERKALEHLERLAVELRGDAIS